MIERGSGWRDGPISMCEIVKTYVDWAGSGWRRGPTSMPEIIRTYVAWAGVRLEAWTNQEV